MVVYELSAADLSPEQRALVTAAIVAELRKLKRVSTMGMDEIQAMLTMEEQKQLMGCDDQSCLAEIAGALGADKLVVGSVGRMGDSSVFNLKRIDMQSSAAEGTVTRRMTGGGGRAVGPTPPAPSA